MNKIQEKIKRNTGMYTLGAAGLIASAKIMQDIFKEGGLKGTLFQNIDTFVKSNGGIMDAVNATIEQAVTGKTSVFTKMVKNKYAKAALIGSVPILTTIFGLVIGHSIDKENAKAYNKKN